jgi:signal transduction histidine kinase
MRIRSQLLLLVMSILLPAMLAAGLAVGYVYKEGQDSQHRGLTEAARAFAFNAETELKTKIAILRTLSNSPALLSGDLKVFYPYARRMAPTPETTIILVEESGRQLINTRRPLGAELPISRASNINALMQKYGADRALVSDVFMAPVGGRHDFTVQVPVQNQQGERQYLLMGINASLMQSIISHQNFPSSWITTIVDRQGVVVARSHEPEQYVGTQIRERSRRLLAASHDGAYESVSLDGIPVKAYFHRVPNSDWTALISIPQAELAQLPNRTAAFLGGMILILLGAAAFAAHWMAQRAYRPVEQLGKAAEQLRLGQAVVYVPQGLHEVDSVGQQLVEASSQIKHATQELEKRVAEAIAKTEQAQQAMQRNQKLEALGRLTGGIAHEFNNLLQTLMTALQVAKLTSTQERVQALLDTCKKAVNRATALTSQLSAFGRIQESRLTTIDLNEQIRGFQKLIEGILPSNIKLDLRLEHSVWSVKVDTVQLELALLNIAINARDAMPSGGSVILETENKILDQAIDNLQPGDYVRICVTDTGAGMAPEVLAKALDPFFTTKTMDKGTGLGLPQAYGFARQSEGTLVIHSSVGEGTAVEIFLPRSHGPVAVPAALPNEAAPSTATGGTVLFVEDDPLVREAVIPALGQAGFTVRVATNAEDALTLLESENQIDVIFSDIMMPGRINGIDLAQTVQGRYPGIKVILATGYTDQHVKQEGVTLIGKPYEITEVVCLLQEAIDSGSNNTP